MAVPAVLGAALPVAVDDDDDDEPLLVAALPPAPVLEERGAVLTVAADDDDVPDEKESLQLAALLPTLLSFCPFKKSFRAGFEFLSMVPMSANDECDDAELLPETLLVPPVAVLTVLGPRVATLQLPLDVGADDECDDIELLPDALLESPPAVLDVLGA